MSSSSWADIFGGILRRTQYTQSDQLMDCINDILGAVQLHVRCYLADEEQTRLWAMPQADEVETAPVPIQGTIPGHSFTALAIVPGRTDDGQLELWLPLIDGTERLGVVQMTGPSVHETEVQQRCRELLALIAHLLAVGSRYGDLVHLVRRTRPMSVRSELLQAMLPPLTVTTSRVSISCILQPFYEMSGDAFDYSVDGAYAHFALIDAIGHGLPSTMMAATALSALRSARRDQRGVSVMGRAVDEILAREFGHSAFVTAVLGRLQLETGQLRYINAGHFPPLLLRRGTAVRELTGGHRLPLGLDDTQLEVAEHTLEHGDSLLLYSDGVIEARDASGEMFGLDRLADRVEQALSAPLPAAEVMRTVAASVVEFCDGKLADDATLMLVQWAHDARDLMSPRMPDNGQ